MAVQEQKLRTLYIMDILLRYTDENHMLNAAELEEYLVKIYHMTANRKTLYAEIDTLRAYGLPIVQKRGKTPGYYVADRAFELPELKLLVDAVQASKFITRKKSDELIRKLEKLTSKWNEKQLHRQVFICNRIKTANESIYDSVDQIHTAIYENRQISFQYAEWKPDKKMALKKNGALYVVSPWALTWDDENYYLIAFDEQADIIKHYRVDKMQKLAVLENERVGKAVFKNFDLPEFMKMTFGMYGGEKATVTLQCADALAGVIIDRFGTDVWTIPQPDGSFRAKVQVAVSPQFFGWIAGIGKQLQIVGPPEVREAYAAYLREMLDAYEEIEGCRGQKR